MKEMDAMFVEFDPFNIACYDTETRQILIEEKLKHKEFVPIIIDHERLHKESKKGIDIMIDLMDYRLIRYYWKILRQKPLWFFSPFVPIIAYNKGDGWTFGLDYGRMFITIINIFLVSLLLISIKI